SDNSIENDTKDVVLMAMEDFEPDSESDIEKREERGLVKLEQKFSIFQRSKVVLVLRGNLYWVCLKLLRIFWKDVPCEGEYFGDPTVEQSSIVRLNLGAFSEGESMEDPFVEPSSSIGIHIN
ncbi:hypothetical protein H5410_022837, partial [Solanum commersonii]